MDGSSYGVIGGWMEVFGQRPSPAQNPTILTINRFSSIEFQAIFNVSLFIE
jgi:hypothetical protein